MNPAYHLSLSVVCSLDDYKICIFASHLSDLTDFVPRSQAWCLMTCTQAENARIYTCCTQSHKLKQNAESWRTFTQHVCFAAKAQKATLRAIFIGKTAILNIDDGRKKSLAHTQGTNVAFCTIPCVPWLRGCFLLSWVRARLVRDSNRARDNSARRPKTLSACRALSESLINLMMTGWLQSRVQIDAAAR